MKKLWSASKKQILNSNLYKYERFLNLKYKIKFGLNYNKILNWSIKNPGNFWGISEILIFETMTSILFYTLFLKLLV